MRLIKCFTISIFTAFLVGAHAYAADSMAASSSGERQDSEISIVDAPQRLNFWLSVKPRNPEDFDPIEFDKSLKWEAKVSPAIQEIIERKTAAENIWSCDLGPEFELEFTLNRKGKMLGIKQRSTSLCEKFDSIVMDAIQAWIQSPDFQYPKELARESVTVKVSAGIESVETCSGNSLKSFLDGRCSKYNGCAGMGIEARLLMEARSPTKKHYFFVKDLRYVLFLSPTQPVIFPASD